MKLVVLILVFQLIAMSEPRRRLERCLDVSLQREMEASDNKEIDPRAIFVDQAGDVYLTGFTNDVTSGAKQVFVIRTNDIGQLLWMYVYGGANEDYATDLAVSATSVFVIGHAQIAGVADRDLFLLKLDKVTGELTKEFVYRRAGSDEHVHTSETMYITDDLSMLYVCGDREPTGGGNPITFVLKIDPNNGSIVMDLHFEGNGAGGNNNSCHSIRHRDGSVILSGSANWSSPNGAYIMKINDLLEVSSINAKSLTATDGPLDGQALHIFPDQSFLLGGKQTPGTGGAILLYSLISGDLETLIYSRVSKRSSSNDAQNNIYQMHVIGETNQDFIACMVGRYDQKGFVFQLNSVGGAVSIGSAWELGGPATVIRTVFAHNSVLNTAFMQSNGLKNNLQMRQYGILDSTIESLCSGSPLTPYSSTLEVETIPFPSLQSTNLNFGVLEDTGTFQMQQNNNQSYEEITSKSLKNLCNHAPYYPNYLGKRKIIAGSKVELELEKFIDCDREIAQFSELQKTFVSGSGSLDWLTFDENTYELFGISPTSLAGSTARLTLKVLDPQLLEGSVNLELEFTANQSILSVGQFPTSLTVSEGTEFSYEFPQSIFYDPDGDIIKWEVISELPASLHFDRELPTLHGRVDEDITLQIKASDNHGSEVVTEMEIKTNERPKVINNSSEFLTLEVKEGVLSTEIIQFDKIFEDDGEIEFSVEDLPEWIKYENAELQINRLEETSDLESFESFAFITLKATDEFGGEARVTMIIQVEENFTSTQTYSYLIASMAIMGVTAVVTGIIAQVKLKKIHAIENKIEFTQGGSPRATTPRGGSRFQKGFKVGPVMDMANTLNSQIDYTADDLAPGELHTQRKLFPDEDIVVENTRHAHSSSPVGNNHHE